MALVPIRIDRTSKPPLGTPLRSDGHWSVQGLVGAWAFNEGAGQQFHDCAGRFVGSIGAQSWKPEGLLVNYLGTKPTIGSLPLPTGPFTVVIGVKINGIASGGPSQIFGKRSAYNSSDGCAVWCGYFGPTDVSFSLNDYRATSSTNTLKVGKHHVLVGRFDGTAISIYCDGVKKAETTFTGTPTDNANSFSMLQFGGGASYFVYDAIGFYLCALSPAQIASLSANPWQIYEPEIVWIEVPDGAGGTTYTDTLTALAESYASVTDVATYVDAATALITAGVDAASAVAMAEAVLSTAQAADTVSDMVQRVEAVLSVVQAADTVADAQAMAESLVSEITASVSVADSLNNSSTESLATEIAAASTVQDVVTILEQVHTTLEAQATVVDEQASGVAENLLASAEAIASVSDLQLMAESVTTLAIGGASIAEISIYLESVVSAATAGISVTDAIVGPLRRIYSLMVSVRDPLALGVSARNPLALNIAVSPW